MSMGLGPDRINPSLKAIKYKVSRGPRRGKHGWQE